MKSIIYTIVIGCVFLGACKKNNSPGKSQADNKTHKVVFSARFSQQTANFRVNGLKNNHLTTNTLATNAVDTSLTNHVNVLIYAIYNASGNLLSIKYQSATDSNFGTYSASLVSGTYTVVVVGGGSNLKITSPSQSAQTGTLLAPSNLNSDVLTYNGNAFDQDTFFQKMTVIVSAADANQSVSLNRIVSKLTININDELPSNLKAIYANFTNDFRMYSLSSQTGTQITDGSGVPRLSSIVPASSLGTKNYRLSTFLLYGSSLYVQLYGLTTTTIPTGNTISPNTIAEKVISGVTCLPNAETILSGNLFGGAGTSDGSFSLRIDTAYNSTPIVINFPQ